MASMRKEVGQLLKKLEQAGCTAEMRKSGHWRVSAPDGRRFITVAASPADAHAIRNIRSDAKRYLGVTV